MFAFRGKLCMRSASLLSFVAVWLLIFAHIGQLNSSGGPRSLSLVQLNTSGYGEALHSILIDPIVGLYTDNASAPLNQRLGLRQVYRFGMYGYCAYVNREDGTCSNQTIASTFSPYRAITADMPANYSRFTDAILLNTTFHNDARLGSSSHAAYYMLLLGTLCAAVATIVGFVRKNVTFLVATVLAIVGTIFLLIGAVIWTTIINQAQSINSLMAGPGSNSVPLGMKLTAGPVLYLVWAAVACLLASVIPYMTSCCTFR